MKLLKVHAIFLVPEQEYGEGIYSPFFFSSDKVFRGLQTSSRLNSKFLHKGSSFKMESLETIISVVKTGDWMASIELADAYLHVPIDPVHYCYLRFVI